MTKFINKIERTAILSRIEHWPSYLVLAGLCLRLISSNTPTVLAERGSTPNYGLMAVEAIHTPGSIYESDDLSNLIFYNNSFALAFSSISQQNGSDLLKFSPVRTIVKDGKRVIVTAYSSTPDQTDSSPFITANGTYVYDGVVATNFLPFGTKVKFPEIYGDKIFTVEDRMASYNSHKMDIWMPSRQAALNFGVKRLAYEIVK